MQVILECEVYDEISAGINFRFLSNDENDLNWYKGIFPKHIQIKNKYFEYEEAIKILKAFDPFDSVSFTSIHFTF